MLHSDRMQRHEKGLLRIALSDLPAACFFIQDDQPQAAFLWYDGKAYPWSHHGYGAPIELDPATRVDVLTPSLTVATIKSGYKPQLQLDVR